MFILLSVKYFELDWSEIVSYFLSLNFEIFYETAY